jgi:hypothetical protein
MTDDGFDRTVMAWLEDGPTSISDRALRAALDEVHATRQRRTWWSARRNRPMNTMMKGALVAAAVVAAVVVGINVLPKQEAGFGAPGPTISPAPDAPAISPPMTFPPGESVNPLAAGTYVLTPFAGDSGSGCRVPTTPLGSFDATASQAPRATPCDPSADDSIRVTFTVPEGWEGPYVSPAGKGFDGPDGASLIIVQPVGVYSDPCNSVATPDIPVGPTVDDFADALAEHPLLDVTTPVAVTLGGYSGKYLDLQAPPDISECSGEYWVFWPGIYAQGPSHMWHLWILDVDGKRLVVQASDFPGTSAQHQAELRAIVESIQIEP